MTGFNYTDINFWLGVFGATAIIISFVAYMVKRKNYEISPHFETLTKIVNENNSDLRGFRVEYSSSEIRDLHRLYTLNCYFQNTGSRDIGSELIIQPIKIIIPDKLKVIHANSIDYPEQIKSRIELNSSSQEITVSFDLLKTGEIIKIQLVLELTEEIPNENILKIWRQIDCDFRIKDVKAIPWQFVPTQTTGSLLRETIISILAIPAFILIMWVIFSQPYRLIENKYITEYTIKDRKFYGDIHFINNDTIAIHSITNDRIDTAISRNDFFTLAKVNRRIRRKGIELLEAKIMIVGLGLFLLPMVYMPYRRYRLKKRLNNVQRSII